MQNAVDAEPHAQIPILWLDVDVRGTRTHGFFEHRHQQLEDRRLLRPGHRAEQVAEFDGHIPKICGQLFRQSADLIGPAIDPVDQSEKLPFGNNSEIDFAAQQANDFIVGLQIGWIDEANLQTTFVFLKHDGPEPARLRLRQEIDQIRFRIELLEIDVGDPQLPRQRLGDPLFRNKATFDDNTPQFPPATFLLIKR